MRIAVPVSISAAFFIIRIMPGPPEWKDKP